MFGGTALVPQIHDHLTGLLAKAKTKGCITVVNTVYDFRNEKANSGKKWQLGKSDESYRHIDLLITDSEEAFHLSGKKSIPDALQFFSDRRTGAVVVTNGLNNLAGFSAGNAWFDEQEYFEMPIFAAVSEELQKGRRETLQDAAIILPVG